MAGLKLNHIYKVYENGTKAVSDFNMEIRDKEFIVFVGPSGCGKSTTLRMIAGLEEITAGDLFIDDVLVNDLEPKDRKVTMVFQNYALYPHMTVYENMAFGLKIAKLPKDEIDSRVHEAAKILDIEEYLQKKPKEMSGGQRQRVALGRAIVRNPKVFLLDEPLSNLDAKLRATMRTEISKLHKKLQTTFIYVTHDQTEAMTMGTRIVVMKKGVVQQIDTPKNLYNYPINKFVAGFIGTPQMNFFKGSLVHDEQNGFVLSLSDSKLKIPSETVEKMDAKYFDGREIIVGIRSEDIHIENETQNSDDNLSLQVRTQVVEELGAETLVNSVLVDSKDSIIFRTKNTSLMRADEEVKVYIDASKLHFFDKDTEETLLPRLPEYRHYSLTLNSDKSIDLFGKKYILPKAITDSLIEGETYEFTIPTKAIIKGNTYEGTVVKCEDLEDRKLLHIQIDGNLIFSLSDKDVLEGEKFDFDVDCHLIKVSKGEQDVVLPIPEQNKVLGKLHRIKAVVPVTNKKGKTKDKKVTGFQYQIGDALLDVPYQMYEKTLAVLVKKFELHDIEFGFSPKLDVLGDNGLTVKLEKILDYGVDQYGVFKLNEIEGINFDNHVIVKLSDDFDSSRSYKLNLKFEDLNARDTHFDITLK